MILIKLLLKDFSRWIFWYPLRWFLMAWPIHWAYQIADGMAEIVYRLNGRRKQKTRDELLRMDLGRILSEAEIEAIVKEGVRMFFLNQIDVLLYPKLMAEPIDSYTELVGLVHLEKALAGGKGVVLAHIHSGNPQMLMPALGHRGYPLNQVGLSPEDLKAEMDSENHIPDSLRETKKPLKETDNGMPPPTPMLKRVLELMHSLELTLPAHYVYLGKTLLPAFRCLKRNELLAIAIDGAGGKNRIYVELAGRKASFSKGPVAMALREGAVLLPLYTKRMHPSYRHQVILDEPLQMIKTGDPEKDIEVNTNQLAQRFSRFISNEPGQYARLLGYKRAFFAD